MIDIKYKNMYDKFISHYKNTHVNPWHEINERDLENIYNDLINSMDVIDEYSFKYFMDYIIKRLSGTEDAHTQYEAMSRIPMNFKIFNDEILVNYPDNLKGSELLSINGIDIQTIIQELEEVITYGTNGRRRYEIEKSLFNRFILFGLPSLREASELVFTIKTLNDENISKTIKKDKKYSEEELFDYNDYRFEGNATYTFIDNCLVYRHRSVQNKFKDQITTAINSLKQEDLSNINTIIIDLRGNFGGNASLNKILMNYLEEHKDKKLICLTDYRVFSGGRYALRDLINLGATTIGEEISTPINCYGNNNWIEIDNHYFSSSECYFHPILGWSASSKKEFNDEVTEELLAPYIFTPDILVEEKKEDYLQGIDTILNYAIEYSKEKKMKI